MNEVILRGAGGETLLSRLEGAAVVALSTLNSITESNEKRWKFVPREPVLTLCKEDSNVVSATVLTRGRANDDDDDNNNNVQMVSVSFKLAAKLLLPFVNDKFTLSSTHENGYKTVKVVESEEQPSHTNLLQCLLLDLLPLFQQTALSFVVSSSAELVQIMSSLDSNRWRLYVLQLKTLDDKEEILLARKVEVFQEVDPTELLKDNVKKEKNNNAPVGDDLRAAKKARQSSNIRTE